MLSSSFSDAEFCLLFYDLWDPKNSDRSLFRVPAVPGTPPGGMSLTGMKPYWNEKRPPAADKRKNAPDLY
jgi:hypothetical protein